MGDSLTPARDLVVIVGELCVDLIVSLPATELRFGQHEQLVESTALTMGSSSAITACGMAALDVPVVMVAVRGEDEFGRYLERELLRRGVDVSGLRVDAGVPTGSSTHLTRPDGDRAILTMLGSIGQTRASDVPDELLARAAQMHVGSYFLQAALWADLPNLFRRARALGVTTSLDGNFDPDETWDRGIVDVLSGTDVFFGNEAELRGITGAETLDRAVDRILTWMPEGATVVCKLGADGAVAYWLVGGDRHEVRATPPQVEGALVDTVGAGDSLAAGYLAARFRGLSRREALRVGVACGTASTRGSGGVGAQPSWDHATLLADVSHPALG